MKKIIASLLFTPSIAWADSCPDLTALQRAAGYVNLENFLWVIGVSLLTAAIILVFQGLFRLLLASTAFLEVLLWSITVALIGSSSPNDPQSWSLIIGSLLIPASLAFSAHVRKIEPNMTRFSAILTVVWGAIALYFSSSAAGFIAVGAFISLLGFSVFVTPFCYGFGFDDEASVWRGTLASLFMLACFTAYKVFGVNFAEIKLFEAGAFWLGSLAGFVGLLILTSRWYDENVSRYWVMNALAVTVFVLFGSLAAIYSIRELTTMVGAFIIFYAASKIIEIKTEELVSLGIKLGVVGFMFYGVWHYVHANQVMLSKFVNV